MVSGGEALVDGRRPGTENVTVYLIKVKDHDGGAMVVDTLSVRRLRRTPAG